MLATIMSIAADGGGETPVNPVLPTMPELLWGTGLFLALWILMRYVLLPPVRAVMRQRDEQRLSDEEGAERAKVEAEKVRRLRRHPGRGTGSCIDNRGRGTSEGRGPAGRTDRCGRVRRGTDPPGRPCRG